MTDAEHVTVSRADLLSIIAVADNNSRWSNESWLARCRLKLAAELIDTDEVEVD